jgi:type IV pilus assembly protein PilY1
MMNFNLTQKIIQGALVAAAISGVCVSTPAAIPLADQPILSAVSVPGNLALALSVEFPTAISVAHPNRTYSADNTYIGYFDPAKCYSYRYTDGTSTDNYFYPDGAATNRTCSNKWSGNYLNWATMQTIDPFRWALTGGYRVIDTSSLTVLEKAWASNQGGTTNFPDSTLSGATLISGATPFSSTSLTSRAWAQGNKLRLVTPTPDGQNGTSFTATYFHNKTLTAPSAMSRAEGSINYVKGGTWPTGVNQDNMSARWVGQVTAPSTGNYTFRIRGDDGVRLKVKKNANGNWTSLGDTGWKDQGATNYDLAVNGVAANDTLYIEAEYYQGSGGAEISLQWQPPGAGGFTVVGASTSSITDTATHYNPANTLVAGQVYEFFVRVKVCDSAPAAGGLESNCTQYTNGNYKPTGLMQAYSDKIRYSAFGYLNDSSSTRDGGVLRARQKFIAPMKPVPGGLPVANPSTEWDAATGVMLTNPDAQDATDTTNNFGVTVTNSGVMNYLNKFGEITPGTYKTYDLHS